jgi:opacity protein-like surface antigen
MAVVDRIILVRVLVGIGMVAWCSLAWGQAPAAMTAAPATTMTARGTQAESSAQPQRNEGPAARTGFQMAFRTGLKFPFGDATGRNGDELARRYAYQLPIIFDLGAKVHEAIFIGAYFGLGFGSEGSDGRIEAYCDDNDDNFQNDVSCSTLSIELGLRGQYHFQPGKSFNPYLGYGIGFAASHQSIRDQSSGYTEESRSSGVDYAKLEAGIDFRQRVVGVGPFLELTAGRFNKEVSEVNGDETFNGSIDQRAWHFWLMVGARFVLFP